MTLKELADKIVKVTGENVTEDDLIEILNKISFIHSNKTFAYFDSEDISSEVWIIALNQLDKYEPKRGRGFSALNNFERWMNAVVKNRLSNLYRDKYSSANEEFKKQRMNIINSVSMDLVSEDAMRSCDAANVIIDNMDYVDLHNYIVNNLNDDMLMVYYDCINEENVSSYYKTKLREELLILFEQRKEELNGE